MHLSGPESLCSGLPAAPAACPTGHSESSSHSSTESSGERGSRVVDVSHGDTWSASIIFPNFRCWFVNHPLSIWWRIGITYKSPIIPKLLKAANGIFGSSPWEWGVDAAGIVAIGPVATTGVTAAVGAVDAGVQTGACGGICAPGAAGWLGGQGGLGCQCRKVFSNVNLFSLQLIVFTI